MSFYRRAIRYFLADWKLLSIWLLLIAGSILLSLLQAWPTAVLVDAVLTTTPHTDWVHRLFLAPFPHNKLAQVIGVTLIGMVMKIVQDTTTLIKVMLSNAINNYGTMRIRRDLFQKLQSLDLGYHRSQPQGDAIYRLSADATGPQVILNVLINTLVAAVTLVVMAGIMLSRSVPLTLVALSVAPMLVGANLYFGPRIKRRTTEAKQVDARMTTLLQRAMTTVGLVQAFRRERHEFDTFKHVTFRSARSWLGLNWAEQGYWLSVSTIFTFGGAIIFGYGGYLVYRDQFTHPIADGVTVGTLMVFMDYLGKLWDPLSKLTSVGAQIQPGVAGAERVFEVLDRENKIVESPDALPLPAAPCGVTLAGVEFEYSPGNPVLRGVDATIEPGRLVAFVGRSGAGKSTVLNLLARFYDPTAGAVRFGGVDARDLKLDDLRGHVAVVPQESPMLAASIADNIAFGRPGATARQVRRAAHLAGADEFIEGLPDGYDTVLAEGGGNLSGGQRQRVAIARALLTDAPVLVLDEPTSALDPESEGRLMATLHALRGSRTIVLVTHRLGTVSTADWIFVMAEGRILEQGAHADLVARNETYARMLEQESAAGRDHAATAFSGAAILPSTFVTAAAARDAGSESV